MTRRGERIGDSERALQDGPHHGSLGTVILSEDGETGARKNSVGENQFLVYEKNLAVFEGRDRLLVALLQY